MPVTDFQELVKAHIPAEKQGELLKEVEQVFDKASAAEKIQTANKDLTTQREALEKEVQAAKATQATFETTKKDLETRLEAAMKGKIDLAEVNAIKEELKSVKTEWEKAKADTAQAVKDKAETDLKNAVLGAAATAKNPGQVFTLMKAEGRVGFKEDGKTPIFLKFNDKGEPIALKAEDAVEAFLVENEHLRAASGTRGSGHQQKQTPAGEAFNARDFL